MAELILAHRNTGEPVVINLDQVISAEEYDHATAVKFVNGDTIVIREPLRFLHAKPAP